MRPVVFRFFALSILLTLAACAGGSDGGPVGPGGTPDSRYDFGPLDALVSSVLDTLPFADGAAILLEQDGRVIYERGFDGQSVDEPVRIASASKLLTSVTVMTLVDRGEIRLEGRLGSYLPDFPSEKGGDDGKPLITIRELLSMTGGILTHHPCIYQDGKTIRDCAREIGTRALLAPPGEGFVYGQATFQVAGAAVEAVTGRRWGEIFEENVRRPLGLTTGTYAGGLNPELGDGASMSVRDYTKLLRMLLDGGQFGGTRILSPEAVAEMESDQTAGVEIVYTPRDPSLHYGLGLWRDRVAEDGRPLLVTSPGSTGFVPWIDLERNLTGVVYAPPHLDFTGALASLVIQRVREIVPPR